MERFDWIADERRTLAALLATLTPEQLRTPSLCGSWTVQETFGHLCVPLTVSLPGFAVEMAKARGRFDVANDRLARKAAQRGPKKLAALLRDRADSRFTPPGSDWLAPLSDVMIHGQDIRRPLGLRADFAPERLVTVLDFLQTPMAQRGFVRSGRLDGLRFEATDLDWAHGEGALVRGTAEALMVAVGGRPAAVADLTGDGVEVLRGRLI